MKRLNKLEFSSPKKLIIFFTLIGGLSISSMFSYWNSMFPNIDKTCQEASLNLVDSISSCTKYDSFKALLETSNYEYDEDIFVSKRSVIVPRIELTDIVIDGYKVESCTGQARIRFVNKHLTSVTLWPSNECVFDNTKHVKDVEFEDGKNFKGNVVLIWRDLRIDKYYENWIKIFA